MMVVVRATLIHSHVAGWLQVKYLMIKISQQSETKQANIPLEFGKPPQPH